MVLSSVLVLALVLAPQGFVPCGSLFGETLGYMAMGVVFANYSRHLCGLAAGTFTINPTGVDNHPLE